MSTTYHLVGHLIRFLLHERLGIISNWFKADDGGGNKKEYHLLSSNVKFSDITEEVK